MQSMKGFVGVVRSNASAAPRSLIVVSFAVALSLLGDQMLYAVLPAVHGAVGIPVTAIGLLLSANRLIRLLTNSIAGYVVERCVGWFNDDCLWRSAWGLGLSDRPTALGYSLVVYSHRGVKHGSGCGLGRQPWTLYGVVPSHLAFG
jgi:hypothetical protein